MSIIDNKKSNPKPLFAVEFDREEDGRWIAEIPKLPGVLAYGLTKREASQKVYVIALRTLADNVEEGNLFTSVSKNAFSHSKIHKTDTR